MKPWQIKLTSGLGGVCLLLALAGFLAGRSVDQLQSEIAQERAEIAQGKASREMTVKLLKDAMELASRDEEMRELLARHGYSVKPISTADSTPDSR